MTPLPTIAREATTPGARPSGADDPFGAFLPGPRTLLEPNGPGILSGLRFAVQDMIDVAGAVTGAGNPGWAAAQRPAMQSASAVDACLSAGAALVGKTVTDELGFSLEGSNPHYGAPINPRDPDALTGGSASGAAAAVAGGLADFALTVDSCGSARIPAAMCGLWAMRPSSGRVSADGILPLAPSFNAASWMARDPETLRIVGAALLGEDAAPEPLVDLRLAEDALALAAPCIADAVRRHAAVWGAGTMAAFPGLWADNARMYAYLQATEISEGLGREVARIAPRLGSMAAQRFASTMAVDSDVATAWVSFRRAARSFFDLSMPPGRVMILPTSSVARLARDVEHADLREFYAKTLAVASIAGAVGAPQIHIPTAEGGIALIARQGADRMLIDRAIALAAQIAPT